MTLLHCDGATRQRCYYRDDRAEMVRRGLWNLREMVRFLVVSLFGWKFWCEVFFLVCEEGINKAKTKFCFQRQMCYFTSNLLTGPRMVGRYVGKLYLSNLQSISTPVGGGSMDQSRSHITFLNSLPVASWVSGEAWACDGTGGDPKILVEIIRTMRFVLRCT